MKKLKLNFYIVLLLFLAAKTFGQEDERQFTKGVLTQLTTSSLSNNYKHVTNIWEAKDIANWNNTNWNNGSGLFATGTYANNTTYRIESKTIALPELTDAYDRISLILEEKFELESYHDLGIVSVSDDNGKTWETVSIRSGACDTRAIRINLNAYAGKQVQLAFELKTDASNTYGGWDIQSVSLDQEYLLTGAGKRTSSTSISLKSTFATKATSTSGLSGTLKSLDAQKFPRFIFANLSVAHNGNTIGTLDESNFEITETLKDTANGDTVMNVTKDATFKVYAPDEDTTRRPVDIVFLMDNSGSMSNEQAAVAANVEDFVQVLDTSGFDYRLALCRFGQSTNSGKPILYNNAAWYDDADEFLDDAWDANTINGGREPSWDAMIESTEGYDFASAAQKIFVLITDETMTGNNINYSECTDRQEVIDVLQEAGVTLYTLVPSGSRYEYDFGDVADSTGGMSFLITDPFNEILDSITRQISSTYTVRYTPTWYDFDGRTRDVDISIIYSGDTLLLNGSYMPGASPIIVRTDATIALENKTIDPQDAVYIEAYIYDYHSPYTQSATLYYRSAGSTAEYTGISMSHTTSSAGDSIWSVLIPMADINDPGIQYYIKATDGQSTTTAPEFIDMEGYPWSFAVTPNYAPVVYDLTEKDSLFTGDTVCFRAKATDVTDSISKVYVYIRGKDDINFSVYEMQADTGDTYIYNGYTLGDGITEFFFAAEDNYGVSTFYGDENSPLTITAGTIYEVTQTPYKHNLYLAGLDMSSFPFSIWTADILYDGNTLDYGDQIGVFYTDTVCDSQGNCTYEQKCAGTYAWLGTPTIGSKILAYGDDPSTAEKEGLVEGEEFVFKIYRSSDSTTHLTEFTFRSPVTDSVFTSGGSSNIESIWTINQQSIALEIKSNLWSTYLVPTDCSFNSIFEKQPYVNQIANDSGDVWMPNQTSNTLTNYIPGYGYDVYMDSSSMLDVYGTLVDISTLSLSLIGNQESTLIGCPYPSAENVESVFSSYTGNIYAVDKYINDGTGSITIETYSPMFAINNWSDKNMNPGEAYYVYAAYPQSGFTFPTASGVYTTSTKNSNAFTSLTQKVQSSKKYMHIFLPNSAWEETPATGSEVRAYSASNELIGLNTVGENGALLILDGYDMEDGDIFNLKLVAAGSEEEQSIEINRWEMGSYEYANLKSAVAAQVITGSVENTIVVYPNPVSEMVKIAYTSEDEQAVSIQITDMTGKTVLWVPDTDLQTGSNLINVDISSLAPGTYYVSVQTGETVVVKKIVKTE